jgi:membrane protein YqaA with SNARE-associated domain
MFSAFLQAVRAWADGAGGLGVFVVAVLDSSVLALPNATDALVMYLTIQHPAWWWYYALMGTAGAVVGSWPLYLVARRGGAAFLGTRLSGPWASGAVAWYKRSAFAAIAGPAFVPPPMPLKIFVLLAGATAYAPWRLVAALVLGRGSRHAIEAGLAAAYREQAIEAFERHGAVLALAVVGAVTLLAVGGYVWYRRHASS